MIITAQFNGKGQVSPRVKSFGKALLDNGIIREKSSLEKDDVQGYIVAAQKINLATGKYKFQLTYVPAEELNVYRSYARRHASRGNWNVYFVYDCNYTICKNGQIRTRKSKDIKKLLTTSQATRAAFMTLEQGAKKAQEEKAAAAQKAAQEAAEKAAQEAAALEQKAAAARAALEQAQEKAAALEQEAAKN